MYIMDISSLLNILQIFSSVCHSLIIFSCIEKFFPFQLVTSVDLLSYSLFYVVSRKVSPTLSSVISSGSWTTLVNSFYPPTAPSAAWPFKAELGPSESQCWPGPGSCWVSSCGLKLFSSSAATRGAAAWMASWMLCRSHWVLRRASSMVKKPSRVRRTWEQTAVVFSSRPISCTSFRSCFCVSCMHCTSKRNSGGAKWRQRMPVISIGDLFMGRIKPLTAIS